MVLFLQNKMSFAAWSLLDVEDMIKLGIPAVQAYAAMRLNKQIIQGKSTLV